MASTQPRLQGTDTTGFEQTIGLKENLQPKLKALSLKNDAVTIGLKVKKSYEQWFKFFSELKTKLTRVWIHLFNCERALGLNEAWINHSPFTL